MECNRLKIHILELDEFLAHKFIELKSPLEIELGEHGEAGFLNVSIIKPGSAIKEEGIDFELFTSEHGGLSDSELLDYLETPVYTSSIHELIEFYFSGVKRIKCVIDMVDDSWYLNVLDYEI